MTEVTKEQFYAIIYEQKLDVCPYSRGEFNNPVWVTDWNYRNRSIFGRSEQHTTDSKGHNIYPYVEKYFITDAEYLKHTAQTCENKNCRLYHDAGQEMYFIVKKYEDGSVLHTKETQLYQSRNIQQINNFIQNL